MFNTTVFEIAAYEEMSWQHLVVSFEHPIEESLATAEFDLSDISRLQCQVYTSSSETNGESVLTSPEFASRVLQRFVDNDCINFEVNLLTIIILDVFQFQ